MNPEEPTCGTCGFPTRTNAHSDECKKKKDREVRVVGDVKRGIEHLYKKFSSDEERQAAVREMLLETLEDEPAKSLVSDQQRDDMLEAIASGFDNDDPESFSRSVLDAVGPLVNIRLEHAKAFEDVQALDIMGQQEFTPVNERISYTVDGEVLQLHLATAFEMKDQIESLYEDALIKMADFVREHPEIKKIGGKSWLNATKTYGAMKERLGFEISDLSDEENETVSEGTIRDERVRPVMNAYMSREQFLERYGK